MPHKIKKKKHDLEAIFAIFSVFFVLLSFGGMNAIAISIATFIYLIFILIYLYRYAYVEKNNAPQIDIPCWAWGFLLLLIYAWIQVLPLSIEDPFRKQSARILNQEVVHSISVNPITTLFKSNLWLIWLLVSLYSSWIERRKRWGIYALILIGSLNALIGWLHYFYQSTAIFGIYTIDGGRALSGYFTAIVNNNTAAAMMLMSIFLSVALIFSIGEKKWIWIVALMVNLSGLIGCDSRSAWLMGAIFLPVFVLYAWKTHFFKFFLGYLLAVIGISTLLISTLDFAFEQELKFKIWQDSWRYLKDFWLLGSGLGSFGSVWSQYQSFTMPHLWASHAENVGLQLFCEMGMIGGLAILWFVCSLLYWGWKYLKASHLIAVGLYLGIWAVAWQQLFDLGLDGAGLTIVLALAYGLLWSYVPPTYSLKINSKVLLGFAFFLLCYLMVLGRFYQSENHFLLKKIYAEGSLQSKKQLIDQELKRAPRHWQMVMEYSKRLLIDKLAIQAMNTKQESADLITWREVEQWIKLSKFLAPKQDLPYYLEAKAYLAQGIKELAQPAMYKAILLNPLKKKEYFREIYQGGLDPWLSIPAGDETSYLYFLEEQQAWKASWLMVSGHITQLNQLGQIQAIKICAIAMDMDCLEILKAQPLVNKDKLYLLGIEEALKGNEELAISYMKRCSENDLELKGKLKFVKRLLKRYQQGLRK